MLETGLNCIAKFCHLICNIVTISSVIRTSQLKLYGVDTTVAKYFAAQVEFVRKQEFPPPKLTEDSARTQNSW